jgi:uncharacterized protein (TIGR02444 family)
MRRNEGRETMAENPTPTGQDSPFWRFSLRFYRLPGVADACIELQDKAGVDVNLLLFLLWNATERRCLSEQEMTDLERQVGAWRNVAVIPLRTLRRALRQPPPVIEAGTAEAFRNKIKQVELEAERLQQEATYALAQSLRLGSPAASPAEAARVNVAAYQAICATAFPEHAVELLLAALSSLSADSPHPAELKG